MNDLRTNEIFEKKQKLTKVGRKMFVFSLITTKENLKGNLTENWEKSFEWNDSQ